MKSPKHVPDPVLPDPVVVDPVPAEPPPLPAAEERAAEAASWPMATPERPAEDPVPAGGLLETIHTKVNPVGWRKFLMALGALVMTGLLTGFGKLTGDVYQDVVIYVVGLFMAGNVFAAATSRVSLTVGPPKE